MKLLMGSSSLPRVDLLVSMSGSWEAIAAITKAVGLAVPVARLVRVRLKAVWVTPIIVIFDFGFWILD